MIAPTAANQLRRQHKPRRKRGSNVVKDLTAAVSLDKAMQQELGYDFPPPTFTVNTMETVRVEWPQHSLQLRQVHHNYILTYLSLNPAFRVNDAQDISYISYIYSCIGQHHRWLAVRNKKLYSRHCSCSCICPIIILPNFDKNLHSEQQLHLFKRTPQANQSHLSS